MKLAEDQIINAPVRDAALQMESGSDYGDIIRSDKKAPNSNIPVNLLFSETTKGTILFEGEYMEVYIPTSDMERNTTIEGQNVKTFAIFPMAIWSRPGVDYTSEAPNYFTRYMNPSVIETMPSSISKKNMSIKGEPEQQYLVLGYQKNSVFIKSTTIVKSGKTLSDFVDMILKAFINTAVVRYDELVELTLECCQLNGIDFGTNITSLEIIFAAQARDASDISTPYRMVVNKKGKIDPLDMKFIKLTQIPHVTSTFTSFAFQDIDYAITTSAKRHRNHEKEKISDIEKIMKY